MNTAKSHSTCDLALSDQCLLHLCEGQN